VATNETNRRSPARLHRKLLPKRRSDLVSRTIEGQTLVLNPEKGAVHQLNQTASIVWGCCDGAHAVTEIVQQLASVYPIKSSTCRKDVNKILRDFYSLSLLAS
jgi:hypothetical protein